MKWMKFGLLFVVLFLAGCGPSGAGSAGDKNDPAAAGGTDEAQSKLK
jgi:hypothetical protein